MHAALPAMRIPVRQRKKVQEKGRARRPFQLIMQVRLELQASAGHDRVPIFDADPLGFGSNRCGKGS